MKDYEYVRNLMIELGNIAGYIVNPISLQDYILKYLLTKLSNNKMNSLKAKNASILFATLCNEYFLLNQNREPSLTEFFVLTDKWNKTLSNKECERTL